MDAKPHESKNELERLQGEVRKFCEERDWDQFHDSKELAIGLVTEASELLENFRFRSKEECEALFSNPKSRDAIEDELADAFFFVLRMAQRYDIDLSLALSRKMKKNAEKYPVEKSRGSNKKYDQL